MHTNTLCTQTLWQTDALTDRRVYTWMLLITHKHKHTHTILHTDLLSHRHFHKSTLLHARTTQTLSHWRSYLHTRAFTHRSFCTQSCFNAQKHWIALTHRPLYTQKPMYTQMLLHTEAFAHRRGRFDTTKLAQSVPSILLHRAKFAEEAWRSKRGRCGDKKRGGQREARGGDERGAISLLLQTLHEDLLVMYIQHHTATRQIWLYR